MGSKRLAATFVTNDKLKFGLPMPTEFGSSADTLRKLAATRKSPEEMRWRRAMGEAVAISLVNDGDPKTRARLILRRAALVNEIEFATTAILPEMLGTDVASAASFVASLEDDGASFNEPLPNLAFAQFSEHPNLKLFFFPESSAK